MMRQASVDVTGNWAEFRPGFLRVSVRLTPTAMKQWKDQDFCYVTTAGRRTRNPHQIEIWFGAEGSTLYLLSGGGDRSDWVKNLRAEPVVHVRIGDREWQAKARVVEDRDEDARARRLLAAKYQSWKEGKPMSGWATTSLPIGIDLEAGEADR
jgi:deazaflavin-dependent oxidoreductase (nitroreductase family)